MKRFAALFVSTALLTGCVSAPSTTPSQTELKAETLGLSTAPAPRIADKWWLAFNDAQLDTLVDEALAGSPSLASALARMREVQSQLSATRAGTYPQVTVDGQDVRERLSKNYIIPPPYGGSTQWVGTFQANLSWSLDLFGKEAAEVDMARATADAAALDATAARLALSASVTQAYIALSRAYALCDVAEDTLKQRQGVFDLTHGRVRAGLDTQASTDQAEALLAIAKQDLTQANANRDLAVHAIAALIGRGADAYNIQRPSLADAALELPATLPADLLARRADIAAAKARVIAATAGRTAAHQAFYPDVNLIGLVGVAALGLPQLFSSSSGQYGLGAALHLPIFDAGKLRAEYAGATASLDQAVADYNQAVVIAIRQTSDALTQVQAADSQVADQRRALTAAQGSFNLATQRYRSGLSPQTNVLDAESILIQARTRSAALAADTASARVTLLMSIGGGFDANNSNTVIAAQDNSHE